ncbi:OmpA family protein, partial [Erwinia sp. P6884]|uniref:OmpA family protein n=1 Tax=Erwinia sp. P6884 TaxID=3141450 RepID=UPI0031882486
MTPVLCRFLALWAALLTAIVCLAFLPVSRLTAVLLMLAGWVLIMMASYVVCRRAARPEDEVSTGLDTLPEATYRQPVVLVCGDLPQAWPQATPLLTVTQGCWLRLEKDQDLQQVGRQLLRQRPEWARQLSIMVTVCPQQHADTESLTCRLLALRWQISQLRKETGHTIPVVLSGVVGSAIMNETLWQAEVQAEGVHVWLMSQAPSTVAAWITSGGATAMQQQVLMNSLMSWFRQHVVAVFVDKNPDLPVVMPTAVLWGMMPALRGALPSSLWTAWLSRHTALNQVAGWLPGEPGSSSVSPSPDFILPLLPEGTGLTPRQRGWRSALSLFTLAGIVALLASAWNNHQLIQRLGFDIAHYNRTAMNDYGPKASAVQVLRQDALQLDGWARQGEPVGMSLGLWHGGQLHIPVLDAIRTYVPPPPPPP